MKKKAVIYARYSSERQTEQSIEGQLRVCREFSEREGYVIIDTYIDRATTGTNDQRAAFQKMMKDSAKGGFSFVIVYKLDRFSRNRYDSAVNKSILKKNGVKVISACEHISDSPEGILFESMIEGYAEYYSAELSQKVKRGLRESRIKGNFTGGYYIYGYKIVDKKWTVDEPQAAIVRKIFNDYIHNVRQKDIIAELNEKGVVTQYGKPFNPNKISRILHDKRYIGVVEADDTVYTEIIPAIVDQNTFDLAQAKLKANEYKSARAIPDIPYYLSGKLYCGYCGGLMTAETGTSNTGRVHSYYKCYRKKRNRKACEKKNVRKTFESHIAEMTKKYVFRPDIMKELAENIVAAYNKKIQVNPELASLKKQLSDTEKSIRNLMNAIEQGVVTATTKSRLLDLEQQKSDLENQIAVEESMSKKPIDFAEAYDFLQEYANLNYETEEAKAKLLQLFVRNVELCDDKLLIRYNTSANPEYAGNEKSNRFDNEFKLVAYGGEAGI